MRLRKAEAARLSLESAAPRNYYKYNIISKVDYWEDGRISFDTNFSPSVRHSTLLIQRREPLTKGEIQVQRLIEGNDPRSYPLTERNLHRIQLRDDAKAVQSGRRELVRLIDRIDGEGLKFLKEFRYLVSINQKYLLSEVVRSVSESFINISIYTSDFDFGQIAFDQSFSDVIIAPDRSFFEGGAWPIRRFLKAETPTQAYAALVEVLNEFGQKDFDILAPVYGDIGPDVGVDPDNPKKHDIVIVMKGKSADAPPCTTSFRQYLSDCYTEDTVQGILCTEEKIYRYKDLITGFPGSIAKFLEIALQDGARVGVWYEDCRSDI